MQPATNRGGRSRTACWTATAPRCRARKYACSSCRERDFLLGHVEKAVCQIDFPHLLTRFASLAKSGGCELLTVSTALVIYEELLVTVYMQQPGSVVPMWSNMAMVYRHTQPKPAGIPFERFKISFTIRNNSAFKEAQMPIVEVRMLIKKSHVCALQHPLCFNEEGVVPDQGVYGQQPTVWIESQVHGLVWKSIQG